MIALGGKSEMSRLSEVCVLSMCEGSLERCKKL